MKKILSVGMILMLGISSTGFSARHNDRNSNRRYNERYNERYRNEKQRNDSQKRYDQIYSRYSGKINSLEASLRNKDNEIRRERGLKRTDWRRVERLNSERNYIQRELDSTYAQLRRELNRNNLTAYGPRR